MRWFNITLMALFVLTFEAMAQPVEKEFYKSAKKDAIAHSLPPVAFSFHILKGRGLSISAFPDKNRYVTVSGPPGGTLWFSVYPVEKVAATAEIKDIVKARSMADLRVPMEWGPSATVQVSGHESEAISWVEGQPHGRGAYCAIYLKPDLLLEAGVGVSDEAKPDCNETISHPVIKEIFNTFKLK